MSHADDDMSDKLFSKGEHAFKSKSAYTHSEDESGKSPSSSPARHTTFESPSREYSDNHFKKSPEADAETHSFDEPSWGTFDNNDDVDSCGVSTLVIPRCQMHLVGNKLQKKMNRFDLSLSCKEIHCGAHATSELVQCGDVELEKKIDEKIGQFIDIVERHSSKKIDEKIGQF